MKNRISQTTFGSGTRNHEITIAVRRQLDDAGHGRLRRVRCSVQNGIAVLWGVVGSESDRLLAQEITNECPLVASVISHIQRNPARLDRYLSPQ